MEKLNLALCTITLLQQPQTTTPTNHWAYTLSNLPCHLQLSVQAQSDQTSSSQHCIDSLIPKTPLLSISSLISNSPTNCIASSKNLPLCILSSSVQNKRSTFIIYQGKAIGQLFHFKSIKRHQQHNCSSKLVSFQLPPFLKLTHALNRSFNAEYYDVFLFENDCLSMKICWDKVWCLEMFLLISWCAVQINENRVWIIVVCCLMITMIYAILIFGKNWEIMILEHKP